MKKHTIISLLLFVSQSAYSMDHNTRSNIIHQIRGDRTITRAPRLAPLNQSIDQEELLMEKSYNYLNNELEHQKSDAQKEKEKNFWKYRTKKEANIKAAETAQAWDEYLDELSCSKYLLYIPFKYSNGKEWGTHFLQRPLRESLINRAKLLETRRDSLLTKLPKPAERYLFNYKINRLVRLSKLRSTVGTVTFQTQASAAAPTNQNAINMEHDNKNLEDPIL